MSRTVQMNPSALFASLVAILVLTASGASDIRASESAQQVPQDTLITLERTVCYGMCPSYKVTISADGAILFEGRRFVKKVGTAESMISQEQLRGLIERFDKINFFGLRNRYEEPGDGCEGFVTDNPSANTSIRINGKSKSVRHYYGCTGIEVLDELTKLEQAIDDAANTSQWIR